MGICIRTNKNKIIIKFIDIIFIKVKIIYVLVTLIEFLFLRTSIDELGIISLIFVICLFAILPYPIIKNFFSKN